jgi:hypothetical protein
MNFDCEFDWNINLDVLLPKNFIAVNKTKGNISGNQQTKQDAIKCAKELAEQTTDEIVIINLKTLEFFPVKVERKVTVEGL